MLKKVVMGLSGGLDSTTLLGILLEQGVEVHCCTFYYGSKHNKYEIESAKNIVAYYKSFNCKIHHYLFDVEEAFKPFKSALLLSGGEIPEGHYESESMKATVVPGRNMIFASVMAGLAESIDASSVALGVHQGDHHIYPDCRIEFIKALDAAVYLSSDRKVSVLTPLINYDKTELLEVGMKASILVPYHLTRTCYKDQPVSCGKCGSCVERIQAFELNGLIDLIEYERV